MARKKMDNFEWLKKRLGYLTDNGVFEIINSLGTDPIPTFRPGAWTIIKEMLLAYYAPNYLRILRNQNWVRRLVYIDMFSGSGVVGIEGLKKYYLGSPLVITNCIGDQKFDDYYFMDSERAKLDQLKGVLSAAGKEDHVELYLGDSNSTIGGMVDQLKEFGTHSLIFVDPFATEIRFDTIRMLGSFGCDLIVTVATEEIYRSVRQWVSNPDLNTGALDAFFGSSDWKHKLSSVTSDEEIFDYYSELIMSEAYKKRPVGTKIQKTLDGHHYFVLFTSTWGTGARPPFFNIIDEFSERIKNVSGEQILKYMRHYTEGGGADLSEYLE